MILNYLIITLSISIFLMLFEILTIKTNVNPAITKKMSHVGFSLFIIGCTFFYDYQTFIAVGIVFFILLTTLRFLYPLKSLSDRSSTSIGELAYPLGVSLAALICQSQVSFITVVSILGLADTAAYIAGRSLKSPKLMFQKTTAGSLACFIVTVAILSHVLGFNYHSILTSVAIALTELLSLGGIDNLTVPLIASLLIVSLS